MDSAVHAWIEINGQPARVLDKAHQGSNKATCFVEAKDSQKFNVVFADRRTAGPKQSYALEILVDGNRYSFSFSVPTAKANSTLFSSELDRKLSRTTILCSSRIRTRRIVSSPSVQISKHRLARSALSSRRNDSCDKLDSNFSGSAIVRLL